MNFIMMQIFQPLGSSYFEHKQYLYKNNRLVLEFWIVSISIYQKKQQKINKSGAEFIPKRRLDLNFRDCQ